MLKRFASPKGISLSLVMSFGAIGGAHAANCSDPWVTQAVTDVLRRPPPSSAAPECNIYLYNGGHWNSYADLHLAVGTYWSFHAYPAAPSAAGGNTPGAADYGSSGGPKGPRRR
jgi:hypothetical protein